MEEKKHEGGPKGAKRIIVFEIASNCMRLLSVALSGLVLICNFFEETFLPSSCLPASLLLQDTS